MFQKKLMVAYILPTNFPCGTEKSVVLRGLNISTMNKTLFIYHYDRLEPTHCYLIR